MTSTSGRSHSEFVRLLFLQTHRALTSFLKIREFNFRDIPVDFSTSGVSITSRTHTYQSHSPTSRLLFSSLSLSVPVPSIHNKQLRLECYPCVSKCFYVHRMDTRERHVSESSSVWGVQSDQFQLVMESNCWNYTFQYCNPSKYWENGKVVVSGWFIWSKRNRQQGGNCSSQGVDILNTRITCLVLWYTVIWTPNPPEPVEILTESGSFWFVYNHGRFDTKQLFRVVVKSWINYFPSPIIKRVTVHACISVSTVRSWEFWKTQFNCQTPAPM
jgi:hypothetical protein